jgi:hypothetical protein
MEIRKKLDAILSSKSRLVKAPRLKGATWSDRNIWPMSNTATSLRKATSGIAHSRAFREDR